MRVVEAAAETDKNRRLFSPEIFSAGFLDPPPASRQDQAAHLLRPTCSQKAAPMLPLDILKMPFRSYPGQQQTSLL
jgi:hypothetical protein